jgi:uncharacterized protein (TIGR03435 family)
LARTAPNSRESAPDATFSGNLNVKGRNYELTRTKADMGEVVNAISNAFLDRPVVDKTGLTGTYDIKMTYTPSIRPIAKNRTQPTSASSVRSGSS